MRRIPLPRPARWAALFFVFCATFFLTSISMVRFVERRSWRSVPEAVLPYFPVVVEMPDGAFQVARFGAMPSGSKPVRDPSAAAEVNRQLTGPGEQPGYSYFVVTWDTPERTRISLEVPTGDWTRYARYEVVGATIVPLEFMQSGPGTFIVAGMADVLWSLALTGVASLFLTTRSSRAGESVP